MTKKATNLLCHSSLEFKVAWSRLGRFSHGHSSLIALSINCSSIVVGACCIFDSNQTIQRARNNKLLQTYYTRWKWENTSNWVQFQMSTKLTHQIMQVKFTSVEILTGSMLGLRASILSCESVKIWHQREGRWRSDGKTLNCTIIDLAVAFPAYTAEPLNWILKSGPFQLLHYHFFFKLFAG